MRAEARRDLALSAALFALAAPSSYVAMRLFEVARAPGVSDPSLIIFDVRTAFYWRAATATWWAGLAAFLVFAWLRRAGRGEAFERALTRLALPVVALLGLLAWIFP